ncbi:unnamed protein product [Linum tenue]|uniref:Uncharacterized protein n=1 Tax=Linum tenue TaxID=586396 RepID=A0AAV0KRX4_9ROSI|nr:unnamed protein product [Linum tenue]
MDSYLTAGLSERDRDLSVAEWTTEKGKWDWERMRRVLPDSALTLIAGTDPPNPELGEDKTIWGLERDGRFRLKSAYYLAAADEEEEETNETSWKKDLEMERTQQGQTLLLDRFSRAPYDESGAQKKEDHWE